MDIRGIIIDSFKYPFRDWKKSLFEGVLLILNLTIVLAFGMGYQLRLIKSSLAGNDTLPEFDDWWGLLVDGFKVYVVNIIYFIIPFILVFLGVLSFLTLIITGIPVTLTVLTELYLTIILGLLLFFILGLFERLALVNMAYHDRLSAAFRFRELIGRISEIGWGKYIVWYLILVIVTVILGVIGGFISRIPFIGFFLALLLVYNYLVIFTGRSAALIYKS